MFCRCAWKSSLADFPELDPEGGIDICRNALLKAEVLLEAHCAPALADDSWPVRDSAGRKAGSSLLVSHRPTGVEAPGLMSLFTAQSDRSASFIIVRSASSSRQSRRCRSEATGVPAPSRLSRPVSEDSGTIRSSSIRRLGRRSASWRAWREEPRVTEPWRWMLPPALAPGMSTS